MKNYTYLLICLLLASCGESKRTEKKSLVNSVPVVVKPRPLPRKAELSSNDFIPLRLEDIEKRYALIKNKLDRGLLDSVSYKYDCNGERNGITTFFSDKGKLMMISHNYNEYSHFSAKDLYFVSNNTLFFAYFNRVSWSFESGLAAEGATKENITEQRLYLVDKKPILCLEKNYIKRSHSTQNPKPENVMSKEVNCKPIGPVLTDFSRLLAFKNSTERDCLGK